MTSSSKCFFCHKITPIFRYNNPRKDPNNINDGKWLCEEHDDYKAIENEHFKREPKPKKLKRKKLW